MTPYSYPRFAIQPGKEAVTDCDREDVCYLLKRERMMKCVDFGNTSPLEGRISLRLHHTSANGVADQAGGFVDIQLLHEPRAVGFGGFHGDPEHGGNVFCRFALGD